MNTVLSLRQALHERREAIAGSWYRGIYPLYAAHLSASELYQLVVELTDQLVDCLAGEPFAPERARPIGASLADFRLPDPMVIEGAMGVLQREIAAGLTEGEAAVLLPRLVATWASIAAGYCRRSQVLILNEQEELHQASLTALKRAEEALRESEARYRIVSQLTSDYAYAIRIHPDGTFTTEWATDAYWRLTGLQPGTMFHGRWFEMVHPDDRAKARENLQNLISGQTTEIEFRILTVTGEERWVCCRSLPEWDEAHERVVRVFGAVQDITARKQAEMALRASETRLRTIYATIPDLVYLTDLEGNILDANPALVKTLGLSLEQLKQKKATDFFAGGDMQAIQDGLTRIRAGHEARGLEVQSFNASGEIRDYEVHAMPITENGVVTAVLSVTRDITQRKQVEAALRASEERYRAISEITSNLAYSARVKPDGRLAFEWITEASKYILGLTKAELDMLKEWAVLIHPEDWPKLEKYLQGILESGKPDTIEVRTHPARGAVRWLRVINRPLFDEQEGRVVRLVGTIQDITERKLAEQHAQQMDRLAAIGRLAATMAHEINNPLQAICSNLDLALHFPLEEQERLERLHMVQREVKRLMAITSRTMSLVRAPGMRWEPVSLAPLVGRAVMLLDHQLDQNHIDLLVDVPGTLPAVQASAELLQQILLNLMLNAIDAMPNGGQLRIAAQQTDRQVILTVADSGPGFLPETLDKIFEPFYTTRPGGTGLGLPICQAIIQQIGGNISAGNAPDGGALVTVTLPLWQAADMKEEA